MTEFDTALDPNYAMYARDIAVDTEAVTGVAAALGQAIDLLKDKLRRDALDSNAGTFHALCRIGQLLDMRNRLTGEYQDIEYLYSDNGEFYRYVAGFVGESAGVFDAQGRPLCVGDTVATTYQGRTQERMIILSSDGKSLLTQGWINDQDAVFWKDFAEADIRAANINPCCTVRLGSCLKDYHDAKERQQAKKKSKCLPQAER